MICVMKLSFMCAVLVVLVMGCMCEVVAGAGDGEGDESTEKRYKVIAIDNPEYRANTLFVKQEDITSERFKEILRLYKIDELIADEADEFVQMLILRNWLHEHIVVDKSKEARGKEALGFLKEGPSGGAYHCGHYATAQTAVMNAVGFVSRRVLSGPGGKERGDTGIHGTTEIWSNSLCKWVLFDAEWDTHFEKDGVALSGLEIRDEVLADGAKNLVRVQGVERKPIAFYEDGGYGGSPTTYRWLSWWEWQDEHTIWPKKNPAASIEILYNDDYCRENEWYRGGNKHWAYDAGFFKYEDDRKVIEWTPNVLGVDAEVDSDVLKVKIESSTLNFKTYQMREVGDAGAGEGSGEWKDVEAAFELELSGDGGKWELRSVNVMGVCGPVYRLVVGVE